MDLSPDESPGYELKLSGILLELVPSEDQMDKTKTSELTDRDGAEREAQPSARSLPKRNQQIV